MGKITAEKGDERKKEEREEEDDQGNDQMIGHTIPILHACMYKRIFDSLWPNDKPSTILHFKVGSIVFLR